MSTSDYTKFPGGTQDKGLDLFDGDLAADITWAEDTVNITGGVRRGAGVRYGIAPLAGHSNTEAATGTATNGIMASETTSGSQGLTHRELIFGVVPLTMTAYDGSYPKPNYQFYAYLVGLDYSSNTSLDVCLGATLDSSVNKQASTLVAGLAQSSYRQESPLVRLHKTELINLPLDATPAASDVQSILSSVSGRYWTPYTNISVSGKRVPYNWMFAKATSTPTSGTAPNLNLWSKQVSIGSNQTILGGAPSEIITREFVDNQQRQLFMHCLNDDGGVMAISYKKNITQANTAAVTAYGSGDNYTNLTSAAKGGSSTGFATVAAAIVLDPGSFTNTRHDAILVAAEKPVAVVYQDWLQAAKGMMPRWVDLTQPTCAPRELKRVTSSGLNARENWSTAYYYEGDEDVNAAFSASGLGILRNETLYDFGFSYYNKLIDYETNVAYMFSGGNIPAASGDFFALYLELSITSGENLFSELVTDDEVGAPWEWSNAAAGTGTFTAATGDGPPASTIPGRGFHINDYEMRFYYRELAGGGEWLPAGKYDASRYWFAPWQGATTIAGTTAYSPTICQGPQGGTVGGQPNGFNDYSPLPKQRYICTTIFQQRAFWWSEKSMHFSYQNNIYAYPLRNIVACPTGKWRGGIVHNQKDLSQSLARLVVFGDTTFSARFTGRKTFANIRVSPETVGQFEIDGSDFVMDYLCDATAFSYRSACVADGVLYFWGPDGIYRDDGVTKPEKISKVLEPNIFTWVDSARDSEVHAVYVKGANEVVWFYPPKVADASFPTYGLAYNVENGKFYPYKFRCQVDASQNIRVENDSTPDDVAGERVLLHCRETAASTVQRTYYFDQLVQAGEQGPARELTVLSVSTPSTGTRRLNLASGSVGITAGGIAANDYIAIQNAKGYAPSLTDAPDIIAKISAVNNGSNYIDIELPPNSPTDSDLVTWDSSATLTNQTAFPIYHMKPTAAGQSGITYLLDTNFWLPDGLSNSWFWVYLYFLFKYPAWPTPLNPFTNKSAVSQIALAYRSMVCAGALTDTLQLINNSANMCQIHHPLRNIGRAANGQALAYALSGIHIGDPWTLEYLEAHNKKENGFTLKEFEG